MRPIAARIEEVRSMHTECSPACLADADQSAAWFKEVLRVNCDRDLDDVAREAAFLVIDYGLTMVYQEHGIEGLLGWMSEVGKVLALTSPRST